MTIIGWIQILLYCAIVVALVRPLGWYMTRVFNGEQTFLSPLLRPVDAALYRAGGVDQTREAALALLYHVSRFHLFLEAMHGTISAAHRTDRTGAVFTIRLPVPAHAKRLGTAA